MTNWIKFTEEQPKEEGWYIICSKDRQVIPLYYYDCRPYLDEFRWCYDDSGDCPTSYETDYWSHLPEPPKEYPPKHLIYHKIPDKIYPYPTFEEGGRISFYWAEEDKEDVFWYNGDEDQVFGPVKLKRLDREDISACDIIDL